jgi:hypothetical protein
MTRNELIKYLNDNRDYFMNDIKKYSVIYTTRTNGNGQLAYVEAENKGEVKQKLREKIGEQIYIHLIDKCDG